MENMARKEYAELQQGVDKLVGKFGMTKALKIIDQLSGTSKMRTRQKEQTKLITTFVVSEAFKVFNVTEDLKKKVRSLEYREARMASYHLLNKYTELSYKEIGKQFNQGRFGVYYHVKNCSEFLSIPKFNKSFVSRYEVLEESLIQFITKIN